jgi:hypothetical protein
MVAFFPVFSLEMHPIGLGRLHRVQLEVAGSVAFRGLGHQPTLQ